MDSTQILPAIGLPVSTALLNEDQIADASIGELIHAATVLQKNVARRMANPATFNELAVFAQAAGLDWSGHPGTPPQESGPEQIGRQPDDQVELPEPVAPDNYCDTVPAIGVMFSQMLRAMDAAMANYTRWIDIALANSSRYLGAPSEKAFRDSKQYLRDTMKLSSHTVKKHYLRAQYFTHAPGQNPELLASQPKFVGLADLLAESRLPGENADRIIGLDQELSEYSKLVGQSEAFKNAVLQAFEPTLMEAGEAATPEELTKARHRWRDQIAHEICVDGPSPSQALRKPADNSLKLKDQADGSGTISMHATPDVYAAFKIFKIHMLNYDGKTPAVTPELINFLKATSQDEADASEVDKTEGPTRHDEPAAHGAPLDADFGNVSIDPAAVVAEDADGDPVTTGELWGIDDMSPGQKFAAFVIGALHTVMSMDPTEASVKGSHGSKAQIVIVQDIQTAHHMLGLPPIPTEVQRPPGPEGIAPTVVRRPNPDTTDPDSGNFASPVPWTRFQSEAINYGALHPQDAEILGCNSELAGQVWNGPDIVLKYHRTKRFFTPAQRKAILARDRGCQAPGCTIPAAYCDIHHILEWLAGGETDETNSIALCSHHHAAIHLGKWTIKKKDGLTFFQPAKWLDPFQPLLRNIYWNI